MILFWQTDDFLERCVVETQRNRFSMWTRSGFLNTIHTWHGKRWKSENYWTGLRLEKTLIIFTATNSEFISQLNPHSNCYGTEAKWGFFTETSFSLASGTSGCILVVFYVKAWWCRWCSKALLADQSPAMYVCSLFAHKVEEQDSSVQDRCGPCVHEMFRTSLCWVNHTLSSTLIGHVFRCASL